MLALDQFEVDIPHEQAQKDSPQSYLISVRTRVIHILFVLRCAGQGL